MYSELVDTLREFKKGSLQTLILAVLSDGPLHGYAIAREIERRSGEVISFGEGGLYPALRAMEAENLVSAEWRHPANAPTRRVYGLTDAGREALADQIDGWKRFKGAIDQVLGGVSRVQTA